MILLQKSIDKEIDKIFSKATQVECWLKIDLVPNMVEYNRNKIYADKCKKKEGKESEKESEKDNEKGGDNLDAEQTLESI
jgi:hypothetical protein